MSASCLCGGLITDNGVSELGVTALESELAHLAKIDSAVVARRSLVVAELARHRTDVGEQLRKNGGMSSRQARKATKTAAGLTRLPETREALANGEIGTEQAEQLTSRMDKPELAGHIRNNESSLLDAAKKQDADTFARTMREEDISGSSDNGNTQAQRQRRARKASMWIDTDTGMHWLSAQFDPVTGARISNQLAAMTDKLWRAEHPNGGSRPRSRADQRRADALETLICRSTAAPNTGTRPPGPPAADTPPETAGTNGHPAPGPRRNPGSSAPSGRPARPNSAIGTDDTATPAAPQTVVPPNNTQLMVIANLDTLHQQLTNGRLPDGTQLPADTIRQLACDAGLLPAIFNSAGQPLWLGRKQRIATPAQRAAVTARDRGCIICHTPPEWCQVHHITWWSHRGTTDLDNLCLLCSKHHHQVHEHQLQIVTSPDGFTVQPQSVRTAPTPSPGSPNAPPGSPPPRQPARPEGSVAAAA